MTKEEIKNADLKDVGMHCFELIFDELLDSTELYNCVVMYDINKKQYKKLNKSINLFSKPRMKEIKMILKLRPGVDGYIRFISERIKAYFSKILVAPNPGVYLKEDIYENNFFIDDLADDLGITEENLRSLMNGEIKVNKDLAFRLSKTFNCSPKSWMKRQELYDKSIDLNKFNCGLNCLIEMTLEDLIESNFVSSGSWVRIYCGQSLVYSGCLLINTFSDSIISMYLKMKIKSINASNSMGCACIEIDLKKENGGDK